MSKLLDEAIEAARAGQGARAEEAMRAAVLDAKTRAGEASLAHAEALFELATLLLAAGDGARAIEPLREAASIRDPDGGPEAEKQRLTYAMNLGEVLANAGRLDEAEVVLRTNLAERAAFYGREHAGYAYGLESLADVLRARGELEEARRCADEAVDTFWAAGNPRVAAAIATRAPCAVAHGELAFEGTQTLPPDVFEAMVNESLARERADDPEVHLLVLRELREVVTARFGEGSPEVLRVVAATARTARAARAFDVAREAARTLLAALDASGDAHGALDCVLGLALIEDDAGRIDASAAAYEDAVARAVKLKNLAVASNVLRNQGLFLVQRGRRDQGRGVLEIALKVASDAHEEEMAARARVALGIELQHAGENDRARALLEDAVVALDPADTDALCARSHLFAIGAGGGCGCGDMRVAFAQALREMVERDVGPGLVAELSCRSEDAADVDVRLAREPSQEELATLDRALRHAMATLRRRAGARR